MRDWMIRAIKTFVQAFFGVLIPAVVATLQNGWPEDWSKAWVLIAPTLAAALAAAISAVWNIILEALENAPTEEELYGKPTMTDAEIAALGQSLGQEEDEQPETTKPQFPTLDEIIDEFGG